MAIFKRKKGEKHLTLPVLNGGELPLAEKLRLETRRCITCGYTIANPMNDRCPRCFAVVPLSEHTNCGECSHQGNCTYAGPGGPPVTS